MVHADPPSQALEAPRAVRGIRVAAILLAQPHPTSKGAASPLAGRGLRVGCAELGQGSGQPARSGLLEAAAIGAQGGGGGGERLAAASQSGPGRWATAARALGLCESEPAPCPRAPQFTHRPEAGGPGGPRGPRDIPPRCASHLAFCRN